ncbi:MAG: hypothetical protein ACI87W_001938 [Halieaceae bacterium]|jgi:membrane protein implicated in regulation of membrane protease activity
MIFELMLRYETWMILGFVLIVLDMLIGLDFFALAFGIGALITGVTLLAKDLVPIPISESWEGTLSYFGVLSVVVLIPLRRWVKRSRDESGEDINRY